MSLVGVDDFVGDGMIGLVGSRIWMMLIADGDGIACNYYDIVGGVKDIVCDGYDISGWVNDVVGDFEDIATNDDDFEGDGDYSFGGVNAIVD